LIDAGSELSAETMLEAARAANLSGDPDFGAALASQAWETGHMIEAALLLARAHTIRSRFADALTVLEAAEPAIDSPDRALEYLGQQSEVLHWGLNRPGELRELLDRAESWWPEKHWRQRLDPLRMQVAAFERPGLSLAETTRLLSDDGLAPKVRRQLEPAHIANLFFSGRTREALKRALSIRPELPLRSHRQALALSLWMRVSLETGEQWPELDQWMTGALDDAVRLGDRAGAGNAAYTLACLDFSAGRYREAATLLAEAELHLEYHDPTGVMPVVNAMQVGVACFSADPAAVGAALERLRARMNAIGTLAHHLAYVVRAEAWAAFATGDPPQAQRLLLDAAAEMTAGPVHAARLTYEAMRAGAPARRTADALTPLAAACDARLVAAYAAHAAACAADDGPALLQVTGELE
jgi:hypothetical protein